MSYARALDELLRQKNLEIREANGYWFPSQLGGCDRQSILAHLGTEPNPKASDELRNLWLGEQIHRALQANVPFELLGSEGNARCRSEEYKLSGKLDALVRNAEGEVEAVEFKSTLEKKFQYELPQSEHVWQVGCYLTFPIFGLDPKIQAMEELNFAELKAWGGHSGNPHADCEWLTNEQLAKMPNGLCEHYVQLPQPEVAHIVYLGKEHADMREFFIYPSEELEKKVKGELVRLEGLYQKYLETKELPAALPYDNWRFKNRAGKIYCDFAGKGCCVDSAPVSSPRSMVSKKSS